MVFPLGDVNDLEVVAHEAQGAVLFDDDAAKNHVVAVTLGHVVVVVALALAEVAPLVCDGIALDVMICCQQPVTLALPQFVVVGLNQ